MQLPPDRSARSKRRPTITLDEMLSIIFKGSFSSVRAIVTALERDRNDARVGSIINISSAVADIMFEKRPA